MGRGWGGGGIVHTATCAAAVAFQKSPIQHDRVTLQIPFPNTAEASDGRVLKAGLFPSGGTLATE